MQIPVKKLPDVLTRYEKGLKFAGVRAMTKTVLLCRESARDSLKKRFTLRNTWTLNSIRVETASLEKPEAKIWVRDQYIAEHETGATRPMRTGGTPIPAYIRDVAGVSENKVIQRALRVKYLRGKKVRGTPNKPFEKTIGGVHGLWVRQTVDRFPVKLLYTLLGKAKKIKPEPWFFKSVSITWDDNVEVLYRKYYDEAAGKLSNK